jgi:thioredoxin 1
MSNLIIALPVALVALMLLSRVAMRLRARSYAGKPLPELPGTWRKRLAIADGALLYFMSPQCGACRPWTARFTELRRKNPHVHMVNVAEDFDIARALGIMATPTRVVVEKGKIAGYHIGRLPSDVLAQFT